MTDEELLVLYHRYKVKRRIILLSSLLVIIVGTCIYLYFDNIQNKDLSKNQLEHLKEEIKDLIAPEITLNSEKIEIMEGGDVDYLKYVDSVKDNIDGDILSRLQYTKIDTTKIGEQSIIYSVYDSSNNLSQKTLLVLIKEQEKPKEDIPKKEIETGGNNIPKPPSNNVEKPKEEPPKQESNNSNNSSNKIIKYFLFSDGYTMMNVAEECAKELKKINKTGMCSPLQDETGIYLGMKLETN